MPDKSYHVEMGIWSERDQVYVWKSHSIHITVADARRECKKLGSWRILETSVYAVHTPRLAQTETKS